MVQLCDKGEYSKVSLNTTELHLKSEVRKSELYDRYTEVLMREKKDYARPIQPEIEVMSEHDNPSNSICETKNSNEHNHQEAEQGETTMPLVDIDRLNQAMASPKQNGEQELLVFQSTNSLE